MNPLPPQTASTGEMVIFALLAGAIAAGALFTITRRNPVTAVMSLVGTFFALAALYASLAAGFVAVMQVSVYAGAIMVLFIFVVMILNREEIEPISFRGILTRGLGVIAIAVLIGLVAWRVLRDPSVIAVPGAVAGPPDPAFGSVAAIGTSLFKDFVFPFEAISLLLLVAIVGGVVVSRSHKQEEESAETARRDARIRAAIRPETRVGALPEADGGDAHAHSHASGHH